MCGGQGVSNHNVSPLILHPLNPNSLVSHNSAIVGTDILIYIYIFLMVFASFFSHNKLSSLPSSLGCLGSLSSLKMDHNNLTSLEIELGKMVQLEEMVGYHSSSVSKLVFSY